MQVSCADWIFKKCKSQSSGGEYQACFGDNADGNIKGPLQLVESQMQIFPQMWSNEMIISAESGQFGICVKNRGKDAAFRATGAAAEWESFYPRIIFIQE